MARNDRYAGFVLISGEYSADLRERQSVRTTFKLTPRSIAALSLLAAQLGIKQKSLFDHLVDDVQSLKAIAEELDGEAAKRLERVPKTYVISRKSLETLERVSKQYRAPRDALVEFSIERIMPLLREEQHKHERRKALVPALERLRELGRELLEQAERELDRDDPALQHIHLVCRAVEQGKAELEAIVTKGDRLDDFAG